MRRLETFAERTRDVRVGGLRRGSLFDCKRDTANGCTSTRRCEKHHR